MTGKSLLLPPMPNPSQTQLRSPCHYCPKNHSAVTGLRLYRKESRVIGNPEPSQHFGGGLRPHCARRGGVGWGAAPESWGGHRHVPACISRSWSWAPYQLAELCSRLGCRAMGQQHGDPAVAHVWQEPGLTDTMHWLLDAPRPKCWCSVWVHPEMEPSPPGCQRVASRQLEEHR